ncbi:hypothetical protein V6N11_056800 [Hibiscus sabdariffa]|uniref:IBH1-like N-terminal domain-containing protein n=1 Tax=Hibiscus sabdariffa TaxID=183260 RepID=A0ABR2T5E2_9ROSI
MPLLSFPFPVPSQNCPTTAFHLEPHSLSLFTLFLGSAERLSSLCNFVSLSSFNSLSIQVLPRMCSPCSLKQEFLKKWIMGIQRCNYSKKKLSILERKRAIKLSADVAMASLRNGTTCWSRALIAKAANQGNDDEEHLVEQIVKKAPIRTVACNKRMMRSKKILKRSRGVRRRKCTAQATRPSSIAQRLVRKRTRILKSLIPGGEFMNEASLIEETLDYILSLRAQVDVMRSLAIASENQS